MNKLFSTLSIFAVFATIVAPAVTFAQAPKSVIHDSRGNEVKDSRGNCVRTNIDAESEECGAVKTAEKPHTKLASVYFEFNKASLTKKSRITLNKLLAHLKNKKIASVTIAGYADAVGSDSYNVTLSAKRAATVQSYLKAHGFSNTNTTIRALGKSAANASCKKLNDGKLHQCMQEDRRVDIELNGITK